MVETDFFKTYSNTYQDFGFYHPTLKGRKGRNQSKNESKAVKKVEKGQENPALAKPPQRPLRLDIY